MQTRSFLDLCLTLKFRTLALQFVKTFSVFIFAWKPAGLAGLGYSKFSVYLLVFQKRHFLLKKCHSLLIKSNQKLAKLAKNLLP